MSPVTTHVLDTARGRPAAGVAVILERRRGEAWERVASGVTDGDGRWRDLTADHPLSAAIYRLTFDTEAYFVAHDVEGFFPEAVVTFRVADPEEHYHVPLLLSPFGYSTYRGS